MDYSDFAFPKHPRPKKPAFGTQRKRMRQHVDKPTKTFKDKTTGEQRTILSDADILALRIKWFATGNRTCHICKEFIQRFEDLVADHVKPRGMGGGKRQDGKGNLKPAHSWCNMEKGSKRGY